MQSTVLEHPLLGAHMPRIRIAPTETYLDTFGPEAVAFAAKYGLVADRWQALVLDDWLAFRPDGKWACSRCGLSVPRQNGKNGVIEIRELFGMVELGEHILHTAHEVKTARKAFKRLKHFFGEKPNDPSAKFPELNALVVELRNTNGQEAIVLSNGGSIEFVSRSKGSARGFTIDIVVMDEAQELSNDAFEALGPTTRSAPLKNRQFIYTGTPPGPKNNGEVFTRHRTLTMEGKKSRSLWSEWSCPDGVDYDDPHAQAQANPALGGRLDLETISEDRDDFTDEGFARECLGMWSAAATHSPIDLVAWANDAVNFDNPLYEEWHAQIDSMPALGIDVAPDNATASVSAAGRRIDGMPMVEMLENRTGIGWVVEYVKAVYRKGKFRGVVIDGASQASPLIEPLETAGIPVIVTGAQYMGTSCANFYRKAMQGEMVHLDQPTFNTAVADARKRNIGVDGLWGWNRKNTTVDITPLVSGTLALGSIDAPIPKPKHNISNAVYGFN
ncbi:hypothetical protein ACIGKR_09015 [Rhodococcus qingshengii]|uniref:hypothetical protein n=1 Tax=Rhodococcus qingshengii TaxID=334542 RepID=UPI0037CBE731